MGKRNQQPAPWVEVAVRRFAGVFALQEWDIHVTTTKHPGGKRARALGANRFDTWYLDSRVTLQPGAALSEENLEVVLHEMLHLALSELRDAHWEAVQSAPRSVRKALGRQYDRAEERVITRLSRGIVRHFAVLDDVEAEVARNE